ncbi:MAG: ABC transporter ATP-binding protein [Desulfobulbaceae bacterium]
MKSLVLDNVSVKAGSRFILDRLSLEVEAGAFQMVIGPNGAGKTTLLRVAADLVSPETGTVALCGRKMDSLSRREIARLLSLVPQNVELEFSFSVEETVLMGRYPFLGLLEQEKKEDFEIARRAMEFTRVAHLASHRLDQLSGGERQRVMIARSICQQPKIMLLDEPTAALDPAHQLAVMRFMEKLRREHGTTIVMVSHDLNLAAMFGTRILLLREGRAVADGPPAEILDPDILRDVYGCGMHVDTHPFTNTPRISLVP